MLCVRAGPQGGYCILDDLMEVTAWRNKRIEEGWHRQGLLAEINAALLIWKPKLGWQ